MSLKSVFITGASGFVGNAICKYFALQGWKTYGLIRKPEQAQDLALNEVIPVIGSFTDLSFTRKLEHILFDVIISTTEDWSDYVSHFNSIIALAKAVAKPANAAGKKPLLLFTSGNKDTGPSGLPGSPGFTWHDEDTPTNPLDAVAVRSNTVKNVLEHSDDFYVVIVRPALVYGRTASWYGFLFYQAKTGPTITVYGPPETAYHGIHIDDVSRAYFALATRLDPTRCHGQIYTVANDTYDTLGDVVESVSKAYGGHHQIVYSPVEKGNRFHELMAFSQALKSEKLRRETGWKPVKMGFTQGVEQYRVAYDAALEVKDPMVMKMIGFMGMARGS